MSKKKFSRNKEEKIERIYKAFFNLILKKGYNNTSTNHVAESAGLSIGTIYNYFPKGKKDIIRKYFEKSMENLLNKDDLININQNNIRDNLKHFIIELVKYHKENKGYHLAFRSAIQSDKNLLKAHKENIFIVFKEKAQKLRKNNKIFEKISEDRLIEVFVFAYNLVNAILYHHLSIRKFFESEDKLIEYLLNTLVFSLQYLLKL
jgi:AcrR family transcriptional regulator